MKRVKFFSLITAILLLCAMLAGCASGAWFKEGSENNTNFELVADGVLLIIIDVPSTVFEGEGSMVPAVLMENALRENKYFDVKRVYNPNDAQPSYVEKIAQDAVFSVPITFLTGGGSSGTYVKGVPAFCARVGAGENKRDLREWEISISGNFTVGGPSGIVVKRKDNDEMFWCHASDYSANGEAAAWTALGVYTTIYKRAGVIETVVSSNYERQGADKIYFHEGGIVMTSNDEVELKCTTYFKMCDEEIAADLKNTFIQVEIAIEGSEINW